MIQMVKEHTGMNLHEMFLWIAHVYSIQLETICLFWRFSFFPRCLAIKSQQMMARQIDSMTRSLHPAPPDKPTYKWWSAFCVHVCKAAIVVKRGSCGLRGDGTITYWFQSVHLFIDSGSTSRHLLEISSSISRYIILAFFESPCNIPRIRNYD